MNPVADRSVVRILIGALGGEGGGVLMNWIVDAARASGHIVQATSVPGVAQRTGSTSYYIEVADPATHKNPVLGLVPIPGRVDVVVASELIEAARAIDAGFVSPDRTTLIASSSRVYATTEKIALTDGRFDVENVARAAQELARQSFLLDLEKLAADNSTFISATMFGSLAGSGALPWAASLSRQALGDSAASLAGFDAAMGAVDGLKAGIADDVENPAQAQVSSTRVVDSIPPEIADVVEHGVERCVDFQDAEYGELYLARVLKLIAASTGDASHTAALREGARRLALWMAYEDVARVADLKTRPERFDRIAEEAKAEPGQVLLISEYMKPRPQEIADMLPTRIGKWITGRVERGRGLPFLGKGMRVRSNGILGFLTLRLVAKMRSLRRRSWRYQHEQAEIEAWLEAMQQSLSRSTDFAAALAELPRVLKGYSDTHLRGKKAYRMIFDDIVAPALQNGTTEQEAKGLSAALTAALADESHSALNQLVANKPAASGSGGIEVQLR